MQLIPGQVRTFSTDGTAFGDILFDHVFEGPVNGATAVLEGIDIQFQRDHGDRHLGIWCLLCPQKLRGPRVIMLLYAARVPSAIIPAAALVTT